MNAGLKQNVQRLVPTASGALRRSVVIEVRQQHGGIALRVRLLGYFKFQKASGVSGQLTQAIGKRCFCKRSSNSLIEGSAYIHLLQQLRLLAWNLPEQRRVWSDLSNGCSRSTLIFSFAERWTDHKEPLGR